MPLPFIIHLLTQKGYDYATLTVKGMSCNHCKQAVTQALEALPAYPM